MTTEPYHYTADLMPLLRATIPLLCPSKPDVLSFFRGCGVPETILADLQRRVDIDRRSISKYEIAGTVVERLNAAGDPTIRARREVLRRVVEFENFSACFPDDQLKAKGLVAEVQKVVGKKDAFTRMHQERDRERTARLAEAETKAAQVRQRREQRSSLHRQLTGLTSWTDVHARGRALEKILNQVFALDGLLVREDFTINLEDGMVGEQIDGAIALDGHDYLVEMKWWKPALDINAVSRHLVRLYGRAGMAGIMISASGYAPPGIEECRRALTQRVIVLSDLQELVLVLEQEADIRDWLRAKVRSATIDREPYRIILPADLQTLAD